MSYEAQVTLEALIAVMVVIGVGVAIALNRLYEETQHRRRLEVRLNDPLICGCRHHRSFHDDQGCHHVHHNKYEDNQRCGCKNYIGPPAPGLDDDNQRGRKR